MRASAFQDGLRIIDVDSVFRVAMKRLRDMLEELNLGRRDLLFESIGRGGYKARFGIKIAFFRDEQKVVETKFGRKR
jgi:hypothetical protein